MIRTRIGPEVADEAVSWSRQYFSLLEQNGTLSAPARQELADCAGRVLEKLPLPADAPEGHRVAGAVVGAIQSGKTGLMAALAAGALDAGFRFVLVLSGLRDDLRTQTALRFTRDLIQRGDRIYSRAGAASYTHPAGKGIHGRCQCWAPHYGDDVNHDEAFAHTFFRRLSRGMPVVAVAKKNVATLNAVYDAVSYAQKAGQEIPFLVLDDECDEASVSGELEAPTSDRISEMIEGVERYAAYIGLTATPAANLLQDTDSPLFPGDFVEVLRIPAEAAAELSFLEPEPDRRYTGGDTFYRLLERNGRHNFLIRTEMSQAEFDGAAGENGELEEALIAYCVSGAIRLTLQPDASFSDPTNPPKPHSMLAHTESRTDSHWELCQRVIDIVRAKAGHAEPLRENIRRMNPSARLSSRDLGRWLEAEPDRWKGWYEDFVASRQVLLAVTVDRTRPPMPPWEVVQGALPQVFEALRLRVINSDDTASDEPLSFDSGFSDGEATLPIDIYSIVIGGNKLSRGLTIDGLCVSYYTRSSVQMAEDTAVQRERWFGYRGQHLEFCRLFTHRSLALSLSRFHEHDEDLRLQLTWNIQNGRDPVDSTFRFLTLRYSVPTAKRGRGRGGEIEISGTRPFFDRVQMGESAEDLLAAESNQDVVLAWCSRIEKSEQVVRDSSGRKTALVLEDVAAGEVVSLLESLVYSFHNPQPFRGYQANLRSCYRLPDPRLPVTESGVSPAADPLLVAAYLRFWAEAMEICTENPAENRFRAQDTVSAWQPCEPPRFNCCVRLGSLGRNEDSPFNYSLLNRAVMEDGRLGGRWGGHGPANVGDEWIDRPPPNGNRAAPRAVGDPGLVLIHVIGREAIGVSGSGTSYVFDRPTLGVVIPEGGPCVSYVLAE